MIFINDFNDLNGGMFSYIVVMSMTGMVIVVSDMGIAVISVINIAVVIRHGMMVMHLILNLLD